MPDPQNVNVNVNDYLALELGRKELANVILRSQLDAALARVRELEDEKTVGSIEAMQTVERREPAVT